MHDRSLSTDNKEYLSEDVSDKIVEETDTRKLDDENEGKDRRCPEDQCAQPQALQLPEA
jgi:hypothetical protein